VSEVCLGCAGNAGLANEPCEYYKELHYALGLYNAARVNINHIARPEINPEVHQSEWLLYSCRGLLVYTSSFFRSFNPRCVLLALSYNMRFRCGRGTARRVIESARPPNSISIGSSVLHDSPLCPSHTATRRHVPRYEGHV